MDFLDGMGFQALFSRPGREIPCLFTLDRRVTSHHDKRVPVSKFSPPSTKAVPPSQYCHA